MEPAQGNTYGVIDSFRIEGSGVGKLSGKSFMVKDLFDVQGQVTGNGNPSWKERKGCVIAERNASCVDRLLNAGAILTGRTQCDELALSLDGLNEHYPTPTNRLYPDRIPGGSSSGSVSVTANDLVDFALGTDTLGSVRVPAAYCGIFGIRPSHDSVSLDGVVPLGPSFDTVGWFGKSIEVMTDVLEVISSTSCKASAATSEFILPRVHFDLVCDEYRTPLYEKAKEICYSLAPKVSDIELDLRTLDLWILAFSLIRSFEAWQFYGSWVESGKARISESILPRLMEGKNLNRLEIAFAREVKNSAGEMLSKLVSNGAVICIPTVWNLAPALDSGEDLLSVYRRANSRLSILSVVSGLPQLAFPVKIDERTILSLSFIGDWGSEAKLFQLVEKLVQSNFVYNPEKL